MLNISPTIMKAVGGLIALVGLFIAMNLVVAPINSWYLNTQDTGQFSDGSRVNKLLVAKAAATTAKQLEEAAQYGWGDSSATAKATVVTVVNTNGTITFSPASIGTTAQTLQFIANNGTKGTIDAAATTGNLSNASPAITSKVASRLMTRLAGGSLVRLLSNAIGILLPAGVLIALGFFGYYFVSQVSGLGKLWASIVAAIAIIIAAFGVDILLPFAETGLANIDPTRYTVYASGIGTIGKTLGDFWAIGLFAGLVPVVTNLIRGFVGDKMGGMGLGLGGGGRGGMM